MSEKKKQLVTIFLDSNVIISGCYSQRGSSFTLLQLCELGILKGVVSKQVVEECRRNIRKKVSQALPVFEKILEITVSTVSDPRREYVRRFKGEADSKDLAILAAAVQVGADFLVTFNVRHFKPAGKRNIIVSKPADMLAWLIRHLA